MNNTEIIILEGIRVLSIGTNAPPNIRGGLDVSMLSVANGLKAAGATVTLLAAAENASSEANYDFNGLDVIRRWFPRAYPAHKHAQPFFSKVKFQLADHFHPRNISIFKTIIDQVKPDVVMVHSLVGIGHNVLNVIAEKKIPVIFYMHELGLACINRAMYRNGKNCDKQCFPCRRSTAYQQNCHSALASIEYISPSKANLDRAAKFFDFKDNRRHVIINPNAYPVETDKLIRSRPDGRLVMCYVGRIDQEKGVDFLLNLIAQSSLKDQILLRVIGDGALLPSLKVVYDSEPWVQFEGWATQEQIAKVLAECEAMFAPSLWPENLPGVVVHALLAGIPVIGSKTGGIPELVENQVNGLLIAPGNDSEWVSAIEEFVMNKSLRERLTLGAIESSARFNSQDILKQHIDIVTRIARN